MTNSVRFVNTNSAAVEEIDYHNRQIWQHEAYIRLFEKINRIPARNKVIMDKIYNHNAKVKDLAEQYSISTSRVRDIYQEMIALNLELLKIRPDYDLEHINRFGFTIVLQFIPISEELALFNIEQKTNSGHWRTRLNGESEVFDDGSVLLEQYYQYDCKYRHKLTMLRKVKFPTGESIWLVNKHYYEKSLENPEMQKAKEGVYTSIAKVKTK